MRTLLIRYIVLWLAGLQLVFWCADWWKITTLVSCFAYPALLVFVFSIPSVRRQWNDANRVARWAGAGLVLLMINAQLLRNNDLTYPVVSWTMYASRRPEQPQFLELAGVRADGTEFPLEIDRLVFSAETYCGLLKRYHEATAKLDAGAGAEMTRRRVLLEKVLINLGARQLRPAGESPLVSVELVEKTVANDGGISRRNVLFAANLPEPKGARP